MPYSHIQCHSVQLFTSWRSSRVQLDLDGKCFSNLVLMAARVLIDLFDLDSPGYINPAHRYDDKPEEYEQQELDRIRTNISAQELLVEFIVYCNGEPSTDVATDEYTLKAVYHAAWLVHNFNAHFVEWKDRIFTKHSHSVSNGVSSNFFKHVRDWPEKFAFSDVEDVRKKWVLPMPFERFEYRSLTAEEDDVIFQHIYETGDEVTRQLIEASYGLENLKQIFNPQRHRILAIREEL